MDSADVAEIKRNLGVVADRLDAKIESLGNALSGVDAKIGREIAETRRHFGVIAEGLDGKIRQVAEAVSAVDSKIDREIGGLRAEMHTEFAETRAMIRFSYAELDSRVRRLEEKKG